MIMDAIGWAFMRCIAYSSQVESVLLKLQQITAKWVRATTRDRVNPSGSQQIQVNPSESKRIQVDPSETK